MAEGKKQLSDKVLGMHFMRRKAEAERRTKLQAEEERRIAESHWVAPGFDEKTQQTPREPLRDDPLHTFKPGRRSFGHFNPAIEKTIAEIERDLRAKRSEERERQETVSDAEMVTRYEDLVGRPPVQEKKRGPSLAELSAYGHGRTKKRKERKRRDDRMCTKRRN